MDALSLELGHDLAAPVVSLDRERVETVSFGVSELDGSLAPDWSRMGKWIAYTAVLSAIQSSE